jgi:glutaredoxin 3
MKPITLYVKTGCAYSAGAVRLLSEKDLAFQTINISDEPSRREEMIERAQGKSTTPQIFVGDRHIGGFDDLQEIDRTQGIRTLVNDSEGDSHASAP